MLSARNLNDHSRLRSISRTLYDASSITTVEWEKPVHSDDLHSRLVHQERFWNLHTIEILTSAAKFDITPTVRDWHNILSMFV